MVKKLISEDKKLTLYEAVEDAARTHDTNVMISGYTPLQLET